MRERLDDLSTVIAEALTKANWHAEMAPLSMRVSARAAAAEIAHTQEWLRERLRVLPIDPQHRYAVMQDLLQAQFVALQKVTSIVENLMMLRERPAAPEYMPPRPAAPRKPAAPLEPQFSTPLFAHAPRPSELAPPRPQPAATPGPAGWAMPRMFAPPAQPAPVRLADLDPGAAPRTQSRIAPPRDPGQGKSEKTDARRYSVSGLALRSAVLTAAIVAVLGAGYFAYARLGSGAKTAAKPPAKSERVAIGDPTARANTGAGRTPPPVRSLDAGTGRVPSAPPMSAPPLDDRPGSPVPGLIVTQPAVPKANMRTAGGDRFVPVIATHRERTALLNLLGELKRQYPAVLGPRQAEAQAVDLGDQGVWHHLVLLPPGNRQQAATTCDALRAAGYPRCTVRPY